MFDISWTDPERETVGQRKVRKEQQASDLSRVTSLRSTRSSDSSKSSLFSRFSGGKRGGPPYTDSTSRKDESVNASRRVSHYTVSSQSSANESPASLRSPAFGFFTSPHDGNGPQSRSSYESVFSGWTGHSVATETSIGGTSDYHSLESPASTKIIAPLSPKVFVTQSTDITVSPRSSIPPSEQIATMVQISAAGTVPIEVPVRDPQIKPARRSSQTSETFDFPIPRTVVSGKRPANAGPQEIDLRARRKQFPTRSKQGSWKPPESWVLPLEEPHLEQPKTKVLRRPKSSEGLRQKSLPLEVTYVQRNIRKMEAASPKIILERLKEDWVQVDDASVYRELELEKQLWMLSALRSFKKTNSGPATQRPPKPEIATRALSLYENHASASFLSALTLFTDVHHLSTNPLSPKQYPNIRPRKIPGPTSQLPFADGTFTSIHAFSLPAMLPASSLPEMLRECRRTLTSQSFPSQSERPGSESPTLPETEKSQEPRYHNKAGTLHLTVLDPSPLYDTLGPKLRAWLDRYLIVHLEQQFRCVNPSRLFPIWLEDENLRAQGSTKLTIHFLASVNKGAADKDATEEAAAQHVEDVDKGETRPVRPPAINSENIVKEELKSVVGRMLWKEMWGSYVQAERWWWEDEEIIRECERLGTCWEYAIIEAVKEG